MDLRCRAGSRQSAGALLDQPVSGLVVAESDTLAKSSKLRQLFERSASTLAVALYDDIAKDYDGLIASILSKAGLELTEDARQHLKTLLEPTVALPAASSRSSPSCPWQAHGRHRRYRPP